MGENDGCSADRSGEDTESDDDTPNLDASIVDVFDRVVGVGVVVLDADFDVVWINDAFEAFFGVTRDDIVGHAKHAVVREHVAPATGDPDRFADAVLAAYDDNSYVQQFVLRVTPDDGRDERWLEHWSRPIEDGRYAGGRVELYYDVTERVEREREIERQRGELARLDHVNSVVRGVNRALVHATSRDEVETAVVERLAAAEPFAFAAFGEFEHGDGLTTRASAGLDDPDDLLAATPTELHAEAARNGTVSVTELDSEAARRAGVRAVASVPVAYRNQVYGAVCVYAKSEDAFDDREVAVLAELGDCIGHAVNAMERRDALLGEQVVEVGLGSHAAAEPFAALGDSTATIVVEHVIPLADGRFVQYVEVDGLDPDEFAAAVERIPRYERTRHMGDSDGSHRFEITATEPPIAGPVADHGGRVERVIVEEGELLVEAVLPQSANVRGVLDALRHEIPDVSLVYHRTTPRNRTTAADVDAALADLTDRQRIVFEAAYFGGYFDWPRESTAEEIAESLGIASPTFHQHLRRALQKLLATFVEES